MTDAAQIQILADALVATGWRLWETSHNNTPSAQLLFRWMRNLALGHFVLETSTIRNSHALDRVGELLLIERGDEYTIRTIDGRELRWENASFVRIPRSETENREIFRLGVVTLMTAQGTPLKRLDPTRWRKVAGGFDHLALTPTQAATLKKLIGAAGEMQRRIAQGEEDTNLPAYIDAFRAYYALSESKGIKTMPIVTRETRLACVHRMQWLYSSLENRQRIENGYPQSVTTCDFSVLPVDAHTHPGFLAFRRQMDGRVRIRGPYPDHLLKSAWNWFLVAIAPSRHLGV